MPANKEVRDFDRENIICGVFSFVKLSKNSYLSCPFCITKKASVSHFFKIEIKFDLLSLCSIIMLFKSINFFLKPISLEVLCAIGAVGIKFLTFKKDHLQ